jgi:hypothetical protein
MGGTGLEQVAYRPAAARIVIVGKGGFAAQQKPPPRRRIAVLIAREKTRELRDQSLKDLLGLIR